MSPLQPIFPQLELSIRSFKKIVIIIPIETDRYQNPTSIRFDQNPDNLLKQNPMNSFISWGQILIGWKQRLVSLKIRSVYCISQVLQLLLGIMERIYRSIIEHISKVHEKQEAKATSMNLAKRTKNKNGNQGPTKDQERFFETCSRLGEPLNNLRERMSKSRQLTDNGEMKNYINIVIDAVACVEILNKKKILNVKANKPVMRLSQGTMSIVSKLDSTLVNMEKGTGFCCGGGDSKKLFRSMMIEFREYAGNWRFLADIETKEMSESYIVEPFSESDFTMIRDILSRNWPEGNKVIQKEVIVEVKVPYQVVREVDRSKPNRLSLANELIYGINREMHPTMGIEIYMEEADRNNSSDACNMLGQIYELGQLLPKDDHRAMSYYKKSHDLKNPYGIYLYGRGFERGLLREHNKAQKQDLIMALKLYTLAAQNNCADACVQLADIYERGHFDAPNEIGTVERDLGKAFSYYCKARDFGSPKALNNLGVMYLKNSTMDENNPNKVNQSEANIQKNQKTAVTLLEEAVATGFPMAFYNLGNLFEKGQIVPKQADRAKDLFYDGASKGCNKCKIAYGFCLMNQTAIYKENFEDQYRVGIKWLEEVVIDSDKEEDTAKAFYYLGMYYEYGFGVDKKPKKAVEYFEKSAFLQNSSAMNKLGNCYYSGFGVKVDRRIAIGYYKQAAEAGNDEALINLGTAYYRGVDGILEKNHHLAYDYFEKAMKAGNTDAYVHLSHMFQNGIVVPKDEKLANELLMTGALRKNQTAIYMLSQRGQTLQPEFVELIQEDFFTEPKPAGQTQAVPYIRDLNKAMSSRVSRLHA